MKRLIVLFSVVIFSLLAMAKDGPFPIASAVGVWSSENVKGLKVKIATRNRSDKTIEVSVVLENAEGRRVAGGYVIHNLEDSILRVSLLDMHGGHEIIEMKAVSAKVLHEPVGSGYHLLVSLEKIGSPSSETTVIFGRH